MILTHGANSLARGGLHSITIMGGVYEFVRIGNLLWTTRNFAERGDNIEVVYPNGDSANEAKYGLLYRGYQALTYIVPNLPTGWRIPTKSDYETLGAGGRLWKSLAATEEGGDNEYGFNARRNGWRTYSSAFSNFGSQFALWTSTYKDSTGVDRLWTAEGSLNEAIVVDDNGVIGPSEKTAEALRFCKDAT
jgi:uncharacterized protein (TIGR02145 family)